MLLFKKIQDFEEFIDELRPEWIKPRNPNSTQYRTRKHGIHASVIGTLSVLRKGMSVRTAEVACGMDDSLIHIDVRRNVHIINKVCEKEISWPSHQEQLYLIGLNDTFDSCMIIDAMDIKLKKHRADWYHWIYASWKCKSGYRNLLVVDTKGEIRKVISVPAGYNNDQFILTIADFFRGESLLPGTTALSDSGFTGKDGFPIDKPFTKPQIQLNPWLKQYNYQVSKHKNIVECVNGIVKMQWQILQKPFEYSPSFFPAAFRCCCILTNRYFRLYGYPGLC